MLHHICEFCKFFNKWRNNREKSSACVKRLEETPNSRNHGYSNDPA